MRHNKWKELGEFPFTKIEPKDFRVRVAAAPPQMLARVIITTSDPSELTKFYPVKILQAFPHLSCVVCEVPAGEIKRLANSDLVDSIRNDSMRVDVGYGFSLTNSNSRPMGPGVAG
jgi:hypothetical protein